MTTLRKGIYYTPFRIEEKGSFPLKLLRLKIPIIEEQANRIVSGDEPAHILLLDYERVLKNISYRIASLGGHVVYTYLGEIYIAIRQTENYMYKLLRRLQIAVNNAFSEQRVLVGDLDVDVLTFLPHEIELRKDKGITLFEVVSLEKDFTVPLEFIPESVNEQFTSLSLFEDQVFFDLKVKPDKRNVRKVLGFMNELLNYGAFIHIVPVIENNTLRIRGVFPQPLPIIKHTLESIIGEFSKLVEDISGQVYIGAGNVLGGIIELESIVLPVLDVRSELDKTKENFIISERVLSEVSPEKAFFSRNIPFIGRLEELERFESFVFERKNIPNPGYINISGVPGAGKSRFVEEISTLVSGIMDNAQIIKINLPRSSIRDTYSTLGVIAKALGIDAIKKNMSIYDLIALLKSRIREVAGKGETFIVLDDADSVGDDTIKFLLSIFLSENIPGVFVITTSRKKLIPPFVPKDRYLHIELGSLSEESLKYFVLELLGAFPSYELLRFIYERTQGIPLYVIELLLRLKAHGRIALRDNYYELIDTSTDMVHSLEDIISEFYDSYKKDEVKTLIDACAIYPEDVPVHILESFYSVIAPKRDFESIFKKLVETNIVEIKTLEDLYPGITVGFKNDLFKSVILERIPQNRLSRLRKVFVEVLEHDRRIPDVVRYRILADIAKGLGDEKKFTLYMWKYVKEHTKVNSLDTAYKAIMEIEELGPSVIDPFEFHSVFVRIALQTGHYEKAAEELEKALKFADEKSKKSLYPLGAVINAAMGKMDEADKFLSHIELSGLDEEERGYVYNARGIYLLRKGKNKEAEENLIRAKESLKDKDSVLYIVSLSNLAVAQERLGKYHEALSTTMDALQKAKGIYHNYYLMALNHNRALLYTHLGEYGKAIEALKDSSFWAEQMGLVRALSFIYNTRGLLFFEFGKYREALLDLRKAYDNVLKTGDLRQKASILANIGFAEIKLGFWSEAESHILESTSIREKLQDKKGISHNLFFLGELMRHREKYNEAEEHFKSSILIKEEIEDNMGLLYTYAYLSLMYSEKEDFESAFKIARKGLNLAENLEDPHGTLLLQVALLFSLLGLGRTQDAGEKIISLKSQLADRQYYHLESIVHYVDGMYRERQNDLDGAIINYLAAFEKTKITGEMKMMALSIEKMISLIVNYGLNPVGLGSVIENAEDVVKFYERNGLKNRAKRLSLTLSEL